MRRELAWCSVSQAAVRTLLIMVFPPRRDFPPRVEQIVKPAHRQALFSQPSMEAFDVRAFCVGFPGRICTSSIFRSTHHARKCRLVSPARCRSGSLKAVRAGPRSHPTPRHSPAGKNWCPPPRHPLRGAHKNTNRSIEQELREFVRLKHHSRELKRHHLTQSSLFRDQGVGGSNPLSPTNLF